MYLGIPKNNLILALDSKNREDSLTVMSKCHDLIDAIKLNYPLILSEGISIIGDLKDKFKLPILGDFKVADVPVTNNRIVKIAKNAGLDAIMVHGFIGSDAIQAIMEVANNEIGVIIVTELTHPGGLEFTSEHAHQFAELCVLLDCYGIQAPGTRPEKIRELRRIIGQDKIIVSCGIGVQGGKFKEAIEAGADFGIIGRDIYNAPNPRKAAENFIREKNECIHKRV